MALVLYECVDEKLGCITLNDPANLNAMGEGMAREFAALLGELKDKSGKLRALVLSGAGRAFSAGGDLEMLELKSKKSVDENRSGMLQFYNSFLCILELNVPLIAAINGHAIGAGLCLASACDIRLASDQAKLGFTFTKLGLHPGMGATCFLPRVVGSSVAAELVMTGRLIDAAEALRIGLVSRVVSGNVVAAEAQKIAWEIMECGSLAVAQVVQSTRPERAFLQSCLEREAECQSQNYASAEFLEGVRAAKEKRKPRFA